MIKAYFWFKERMFRIFLWSIMIYFAVAEFGKTQNYFDAVILFVFLWSIQRLGAVAFVEKQLNLDKKRLEKFELK